MSRQSGDQLPHDLLQTFYLSFRHSQGNALLQDRMLQLAGYWFYPFFAGWEARRRNRLLAAAGNIAVRMGVPTAHILIPPDKAESEYSDRWYDFTNAVRSAAGPYDAAADPCGRLLRDVGDGVVRRDIIYQQPGNRTRPSARRPGGDPHESHFREYVLRGRPVHVPFFDRVYAHVRSLHETQPMEHIGELAAEWERNHPRLSFYAPQPD